MKPKTAINRKTGERWVLESGEWRKLPAPPPPWWHWSIISGSERETKLRRQQEPGWGARRDTVADPSTVEPRNWPD